MSPSELGSSVIIIFNLNYKCCLFAEKNMVYKPHLLNINVALLNIHCSWDFPGGPVVKNLNCNSRNSSSIPGWGTKIPHAM